MGCRRRRRPPSAMLDSPVVKYLMSIPSHRTMLACCGAILLTVTLACSDSTGPNPILRSLAGTYDLSTVLESLTYTDSCPASVPAGSPLICHDTTVANTVGTLDG